MGKNALIATSLVAALPAGFMVYLMVDAFLSHTENMATIMYVIAGSTLAVGAVVVLMPVGILLFAPSNKAPKPKDQEADDEEDGEEKPASPKAAAVADDELIDDDEFEEDELEDDEYEFEDDED